MYSFLLGTKHTCRHNIIKGKKRSKLWQRKAGIDATARSAQNKNKVLRVVCGRKKNELNNRGGEEKKKYVHC